MRSKLLERICIVTIGIFILGGIAYGLNLSRVKTWSAEVLTHTDLNAEFDNIVNHPIGTADITDGTIVNADINSSAGITASKLDLTTAGAIGSTSASTGAFTTLTASSATTLNGDTTIGNATGDALTFHPSAWTLTNAVTVTGTWTNLGTVTTADINGGSIDGVTIGAASAPTTTNIGTVAAGTWQGTDVGVEYGGTGVSTFTDGGILIGNGTGAIVVTAVLADGEILVGDGTTDPVAESGATLRTSIGVAIGTNVQAYDADLTTYAGITPSANIQTFLGSADYSTARTNLGVAIGTNVQAYDAQLADVAGLTATDNGVIIGNGSNFVVEEGATLKTSLGLTIGTNVQAYDAQLDDLADGSLSGAGTVNTSALTGTTYLPDATVDTTALKTATSEVSAAPSNNTLTLTGGTYCFYPQIKGSITDSGNWQAGIKLYIADAVMWTTYATNISLYTDRGGATIYAQARYVTASGEDYWLWLLIDKSTKDILSMSGAPDAPAYGNSNDFNKEPHPFLSYNPTAQEIILIEKSLAKAIQTEAQEKGLSVLELVDRDYKIDFSQTYPYVPMHSGQFSPNNEPVLVTFIPKYIQVRKLIRMDVNDKAEKEKKIKQKDAENKIKENQRKERKQQILNKLNITEEEAELLLK